MTKPKKNDPLQKTLIFHSAPSLTKCSLFTVADGLKQQVPPTRFIRGVNRFGLRAKSTSLLTSQNAPFPSHRNIQLARNFKSAGRMKNDFNKLSKCRAICVLT